MFVFIAQIRRVRKPTWVSELMSVNQSKSAQGLLVVFIIDNSPLRYKGFLIGLSTDRAPRTRVLIGAPRHCQRLCLMEYTEIWGLNFKPKILDLSSIDY